eukprot:1159105-Pelagomonas_calceolata.AAC.1
MYGMFSLPTWFFLGPGQAKIQVTSIQIELPCHPEINDYHKHQACTSFSGDFGGGAVLGAGRWRAGEGDSGHPGAWRTTLQIPIKKIIGKLRRQRKFSHELCFWLSPRLAVSSQGLKAL